VWPFVVGARVVAPESTLPELVCSVLAVLGGAPAIVIAN
jgi:Ca2+/Na+ antiporter